MAEEQEPTYEDDETTVDAPAEEVLGSGASDDGDDDTRTPAPAQSFSAWFRGAPLPREMALLFGRAVFAQAVARGFVLQKRIEDEGQHAAVLAQAF